MPHIFDFKECLEDVHTIEVNPKGWRGPFAIEYALAQHSKFDTQVSIVWRIKGTTHTFSIYERRLNVISNGNYKAHFEQTLQAFRDDYLSWFTNPAYDKCEWRKEYEEQYGKLILPDTGRDNKS